jgi:Oxysterol-binding protein
MVSCCGAAADADATLLSVSCLQTHVLPRSWRICRYNLSAWAIKLNEITPGLEEKLAPTDCRLRPDQHATEAGDYDEVRSWMHKGLGWDFGGLFCSRHR